MTLTAEKDISDQNSFSPNRNNIVLMTVNGEGRKSFSPTNMDITHQKRIQKVMPDNKYIFLFFSEIQLFTRNTSTYTLWIKRI